MEHTLHRFGFMRLQIQQTPGVKVDSQDPKTVNLKPALTFPDACPCVHNLTSIEVLKLCSLDMQ